MEGEQPGQTATDRELLHLATPAPGETTWQTITRWRRLIRVAEKAVKQDERRAIVESRGAGVKAEALAEAWGVSKAWIYTIAPVREKK